LKKNVMLRAFFKKYQLNFIHPAGTSRGVMHTRDSWFVFVSDDDCPEMTGTGEISPLAGLSAELDDTFELVISQSCKNINIISSDLHHHLVSFPSIRFGFEMALKDLSSGGKRLLFSSEFTGGKAGIPINGLIWMGDYKNMISRLREKIMSGFTCIKVKIGAIDFEEEIRLIAHIRKQFGNQDIEIRLDANGAFTPEEAKEKLCRLADFNIHSVEQPIKAGQWHEMAALCEASPIPVALDEELLGVNELSEKQRLLNTIKPPFIIIKPGLIGGFRASEEWIELAGKTNTHWWFTSALESNIGLNAIAQWTFTKNIRMPQGLGTGMLFSNNIPSPLEVVGSQLTYNKSKNWKISNIYE